MKYHPSNYCRCDFTLGNVTLLSLTLCNISQFTPTPEYNTDGNKKDFVILHWVILPWVIIANVVQHLGMLGLLSIFTRGYLSCIILP